MTNNKKLNTFLITAFFAAAMLNDAVNISHAANKNDQPAHSVSDTIEVFTKNFSTCPSKSNGDELRIKNIVKNTVAGMDNNKDGLIDSQQEPAAYKTINAFTHSGITVCSGNLSKDDPDALLTMIWGTPNTTFFINQKADPNVAQTELRAAMLFMGAGVGMKPYNP